MSLKLSVELIPESAWNKNVRSVLAKEQWDAVRKFVCRRVNNLCEICGGRGPKWPVECHEVFSYNMRTKIQKLVRLIALCPSCHSAKHLGFANSQGKLEDAIEHLKKVNKWTDRKAEIHIGRAGERNEERGRIQWKLDLTYLNQFGFKLEKPK